MRGSHKHVWGLSVVSSQCTLPLRLCVTLGELLRVSVPLTIICEVTVMLMADGTCLMGGCEA